ncbi:hypothetical protein HGM15179_022191, partial [Zosterops borbonicus]
VAIKKINLQGVSNMQDIVSEIIVMKRNRSPHVVNYLDSYLVCKELWLVMEYMDGGTLYDAINETQMCKDETAIVSWECLQGLDYLHSNHVVHRDLKSLNILLRTDGSVKLGQYILGQVQQSRDMGGVGMLLRFPIPKPWLNGEGGCKEEEDAPGQPGRQGAEDGD